MKRSAVHIALLAVAAVAVLYLFFWKPLRSPSPEMPRLVLLNWEDYIDRAILTDFEKETGIAVTVVEYHTMDESVTLLQNDPAAYDLVIANEGILDFLRKAELLRPFDKEQLVGSDRVDGRFSRYLPLAVPYLWSAAGFMVDRRQVPDDADSVDVLWDPHYRGKVRLLDDVREALFPVLLKAGRSINADDPAEVAAAAPLAEALRDNGVSFGDTFENIARLLDGTVWIVQTYNGDYLYKAHGRPEYRFFLPREGFPSQVDLFMLPKATRNAAAAHRFVSFCLRPEVAARNTDRYFYANLVKGSDAFLRPELRDNAIMFPAAATLARGVAYREVGEAYPAYQRLFNLMKRSRP